MPIELNLFLTILAVVVILFTAFASLEMTRTATAYPAASRNKWTLGAALLMGTGIWTMHFVATTGLILSSSAVLFAIPTVSSIIPAIIGVFGAFRFLTHRGMHVANLLIAAAMMTTGIVAMHYWGMTAWHLPGHSLDNPIMVVLSSAGLAFLASLVALWLAFRTVTPIWQVLGAAALGLGVLFMHYTAIMGADLVSSPILVSSDFALENLGARRASTVMSMIMMVLCTAAALNARHARVLLALQFSTSDTLRQSQKMEALGQLTGGIAHDFNNLLQVISGSLDILERNPPADRVKKFQAAIRQATDRGASLTRQLLAFSRRQNFISRPIDLDEHLCASKSLWLPSLATANIDLNVNCPPDLWNIAVDPDALDVAMLNMVVNARDAMPDGGTITITAKNLHISTGSLLSFQSKKVGDYVEIAVTDTGEGMSKEVQGRVFEPFFTTKDVGNGTGLGLAQVYGFVEHSEGSIVIESEPGKGTTMRLFFPRTMLEVEKEKSPQPVKSKPQNGTILVVEDDPNVASITTAFLEELGYEVWFAGTAVAAVFALKDRVPSIILTDIILPGAMSGLDLATQVADSYPDVPVVLMTGYTPEMDRVQALGYPVLKKPYLLDDLAKTLQEAKSK